MAVLFVCFMVMVIGYGLLVIDSFLYCKGTKKNNAKQEFSGFISDLFQMLKLGEVMERKGHNWETRTLLACLSKNFI